MQSESAPAAVATPEAAVAAETTAAPTPTANDASGPAATTTTEKDASGGSGPVVPAGLILAEVAYDPASISSREGQERMLRWGMKDHLRVKRFKFSDRFRRDEAGDFVNALFRSPEVVSALSMVCNRARGSPPAAARCCAKKSEMGKVEGSSEPC